jgi:tetratricopeptide (TPR) repeat protein
MRAQNRTFSQALQFCLGNVALYSRSTKQKGLLRGGNSELLHKDSKSFDKGRFMQMRGEKMTKRAIGMMLYLLCVAFASLCAPQRGMAAQDQRLLEGATGANEFTASLNRLRSYSSSGDLDMLLKEALKIMKAEPNLSFMARMELLSAYRQKNRLDELCESLLKELQADSGNPSIYAVFGELYRAQGKPLEAIEMYEKALKLNPNDIQMLSSLGSIYFSLRSYEKTISLLDRAIALSNSGFSYYAMLANCYVQLGRKDEAAKLADGVRKKIENEESPISPTMLAMSYGTLGDIYRETGKYDEAIKALQKAMELAPSMGTTFQNRLAVVYARAGKPELAEKMRRDSIPEAARIGKDAIDFILQDLFGKKVRFSDFKGKTVLLDFWATWCSPCIAEIPQLEALHRKYKEKGLVVIGMNTENDHAKVRDFIRDKISYPVLLDAEGKSKEYGVEGLPAKIYIDGEGKIRYRDLGFNPGKENETEDKIQRLLQEAQRR